MIKRRWHAAILLLVGCSGGAGAASDTVAPSVNSARGVVESFMEAVADSNLTRMASLWGTSAGPASKTRQPSDYERRVSIMQSYLRNESHRLLPATAGAGSGSREDVQVEIRRELCTWVVPFTAIQLADGSWLVNQVDLTKAGNPARPCAPGAGQDTTQSP